jgi:hypothetical protein
MEIPVNRYSDGGFPAEISNGPHRTRIATVIVPIVITDSDIFVARYPNRWRFAMNKLFFPVAFAALCLPILAAAQSAFDGTWKIDMSKANFSKKPDVLLLQGGMFECKTCAPPYTIKADGTDQPVSGHPYFDTVAITVVNDHQIQETDKKNGRAVSTSTSTLSSDGNTLTFEFTDSSNSNGGPPVTGKGESTRVAKGPAGSLAVSGSWRISKFDGISDNGVEWTYKVTGGEITMTAPTGQSYTAKLNGPDAPVTGDPGTTSVSVKIIGKNTLEETDKRDGKVISVWKMTVADDGKTAKGSSEDKLQDRTSEFDLIKQ